MPLLQTSLLLAQAEPAAAPAKGHQFFSGILEKLPPWAFDSIGSVAVWQLLGLAVALLLGFTGRWVVRRVASVIKWVLRNDPSIWHDRIVQAVVKPLGLAVASFIWLVSVHILGFEGFVLNLMTIFLKILITISIVWIASALCDLLKDYLQSFSRKDGQPLDPQIVLLVTRCLKVFVIIIGLLLGAQNMGIEVFSVLAGLGIGGLALALAAKDTLANLFGSVMIMIDRPFRIGHLINVGGKEGVVEDIGFRSTRLRTPYNSILTIANSELAMAPVDNMSLRHLHRSTTTLGVTYDTGPDRLEKFIAGIKEILKENPSADHSKSQVSFQNFGASSLDIQLVLFLDAQKGKGELEEKQAIFLGVMRLAEKMGINFAYPTQTLHIGSLPEKGIKPPSASDPK